MRFCEVTLNTPAKKFHLVFSIIMGAMKVVSMTFVITLVNLGWIEHFLMVRMKSFGIAYAVAMPVILFVAPLARKIAGNLPSMLPGLACACQAFLKLPSVSILAQTARHSAGIRSSMMR